jgi:hypothetical protein
VKIICVANQKGGIGKSTRITVLAGALAADAHPGYGTAGRGPTPDGAGSANSQEGEGPATQSGRAGSGGRCLQRAALAYIHEALMRHSRRGYLKELVNEAVNLFVLSGCEALLVQPTASVVLS